MLAELINYSFWVLYWVGCFVTCYELIKTLNNGNNEQGEKRGGMRFILFGGDECFYAKGGINDLVKSSNSVSELVSVAENEIQEKYHKHRLEWWHIFDTKTKKIIKGTKHQAWGADELNDLIAI